jgi:hypothetical protein
MARLSTTGANQALATTNWGFVSLHTSDPGTTGTPGEVSGGSPAYARVAVTWNAASSGSVTNSSAVTINAPASTTFTHFGIWSASTAGTYYIGGALGTSITTGTSQGTITIASGAITVSAS